ncbi:DUF3883 domain-containing protein [Paenibacillus solani]|uniref:Protein NO VEIN C-terminal domain-containing protein n=1 Tax=Paenibacillus solani TaxID=1705565 RepID=A0A0M1P7T8_9BACL|nr:DUF3883 domain-containing protein [Paenibacillus solani]KOR90370.1 hypothetical protein AM231_15395 [Paenibacillus solani]
MNTRIIENTKLDLVTEEMNLEASSILYSYNELRSKFPDNIDYLKLHEIQIQIGKLGEAFAYEYELTKLYVTEYQALVDNSKAADPTNGYDILSFDTDGTKLYIEVKTSINDESDFYITQNEIDTARDCLSRGEKYLIYRITNIMDERSRVKVNVISDIINSNIYVVEPYHYKVRIKEDSW